VESISAITFLDDPDVSRPGAIVRCSAFRSSSTHHTSFKQQKIGALWMLAGQCQQKYIFRSTLEKFFQRRIFIFEDNKKAAISAPPPLPPILPRKRGVGFFAFAVLLLLVFSCDLSC
jgi:hypothetical protein